MESIINYLYMLIIIAAVVFSLVGGAVGYLIGLWKASKIYDKFIDYVSNEFMENIKNQVNK